MLADVEDAAGTGRKAAVEGLRICGKTGTAEMPGVAGILDGQAVWFASFAPYEQPRYAVVVMVEGGISGGDTCAPLAKLVYQALMARETTQPHASLAAKN
jgi:cell division protein FtsI/penicillin-binding protein 2